MKTSDEPKYEHLDFNFQLSAWCYTMREYLLLEKWIFVIHKILLHMLLIGADGMDLLFRKSFLTAGR